jgi:competence ComEA-like helix-hairpin-helix protein
MSSAVAVLAFLNVATAKEIVIVPGIGKAKAEKIVAHREMIGEFADFEDVRCKGVGDAVIESLHEGAFELPSASGSQKGSPTSVADLESMPDLEQNSATQTVLEFGNHAQTEESKSSLGALESLGDYTPRSDGSHLQLGMTPSCMMQVFHRIGVADWKSAPEICQNAVTIGGWSEDSIEYDPLLLKLGMLKHTAYGDTDYRACHTPVSGYRRGDMKHRMAKGKCYGPKKNLAWDQMMDECNCPLNIISHQEQKKLDKPFYEKLVGYDLQAKVDDWLRNNGHEDKSLCEVVLLDPKFADLRSGVGVANVFCSHMQQGDPWDDIHRLSEALFERTERKLGRVELLNGKVVLEPPFEKHLRCLNSDRKDKGGVEAVAAVLRRAAKDTQSSLGSYYVWMDYSSLRQCQSDFKPELVVSLIDKIGRDGGLVVGLFDGNHAIMKRSFCVLEVYATQLARAEFAIHIDAGSTCAKAALLSEPIDSSQGETGDTNDKKKIDSWIEDNLAGGYGELNEAVTEAILDSFMDTLQTGHQLYFSEGDTEIRKNIRRQGYTTKHRHTKVEERSAHTTRTGRLYHLEKDCSRSRGKVISVPLWQAVKARKRPCEVCAGGAHYVAY